ncbi:MAG: DUF1285 domain-containing protein [Rhodospirillaceae bacterium]|nr:DUF1285 domain-containing protein [Rhodospirillaceae bacterium]
MGPETPVTEAKSPAVNVTKPPLGGGVDAGLRLPPICGDFGMRIDRNGTWFYQGSPIGRLALVKLFSTVLRRDDEGVYWLTTPVENGRIEVEDAPFIAVEAFVSGEGRSRAITLRTNVDDMVPLDHDHPLRVAFDAAGEPRPYIKVRGQLEARLNRAVYYQLVDLGEAAADDDHVFGVWSSGTFFPLGKV